MSKITVLMATYNGEKYIYEQMESILNQTRKVDEVIIIDDASLDKTVEIVKDFIDKNCLTDWRIIVNEYNKGWKNNFMQGLKMCTGEYIFLCDQDDVWNDYKVAEMTDILKTRPEILLLASNYESFYTKNDITIKRVKMRNDKTIDKYPFNEKWLFVKRPGCVYAFRKDMVKYIDEYSFDNYPHDAFLWRMAELLDGLYIYNRMTIHYRRHEKTTTGHELRNGKNKIYNLDYYIKVIARIKKAAEQESIKDKTDKLNYINSTEKWCVLRTQALANGNFKTWLKCGKYIKYFYNYRSWFADFIMLNDYKK